MNFNEWLLIREAITKAILRVCNEVSSYDPDLRAAKVQTNSALEDVLGHQLDYFGICIEEARRWVKGQDIIDLATQVANTIMSELNDPQGRLAMEFAQAADNPDHVGKSFRRAVQLRIRRDSEFFTQRRRPTKMVHAGSITNPGNREETPDIFGPDKTAIDIAPDFHLENLKRYVEEELQTMLDAAPNRQKARYANAILVARERMRHAPHFLGIDELNKMFSGGENGLPKISKGTLHTILKIIEDAVGKVGERFDDETLRQGAERGGPWKKAGG